MRQYLNVLQRIARYGVRTENRTGVATRTLHGEMMKFDLSEGFPILTTKKVNFRAIVAELLGFIRGYDNAEDFRKLGTKIWDANANENEAWLNSPWRRGEDDLGKIYGVVWRNFYGVDQLANAVEKLRRGIDDRRLIITGWNPPDIEAKRAALPCCHLLHQYGIQGQRLNLCMYQRSCDFPLGIPFNISSYALLLSIMARITGYEPGELTMFLMNCHIYENQLEGVHEQLQRKPKPLLPRLVINEGIQRLEDLEDEKTTVDDFHLEGYVHHPAIKFPFAV